MTDLMTYGSLWRRLVAIAALATALACAAAIYAPDTAFATEVPATLQPDDSGATDPAPAGESEDGAEEEGASTISTVFYWVVAAGALTYLVLSRRGDRKTGKHELSNLRTAERKRQVREELVSRAEAKLDDATRKAEALEQAGASERAIGDARGAEILAKEQLTKHQVELEVAKEREREALAAVEEHDRLVQEEEERKEREAQRKAEE